MRNWSGEAIPASRVPRRDHQRRSVIDGTGEGKGALVNARVVRPFGGGLAAAVSLLTLAACQPSQAAAPGTPPPLEVLVADTHQITFNWR
jgi:hypothetical protein